MACIYYLVDLIYAFLTLLCSLDFWLMIDKSAEVAGFKLVLDCWYAHRTGSMGISVLARPCN